jgi:predicted Rossmann-fold nucleotide-binding protein
MYRFCCSDTWSDYTDAASELGRQLAERNMTLLYGGATVGCMGEMGRAVREAPGVARGFIPKKLAEVRSPYSCLSVIDMLPFS